MLDSAERFDVVVVGAKDPSAAPTVDLAAKLARYSGRSSSAIQHALLSGEVEIHRGFAEAEAEAAAQRLGDLGARVELRLHGGGEIEGPAFSTGFDSLPQLEPDLEPHRGASRPARTPSPDPPPTFGGLDAFGGGDSGGSTADVELDRSRPQGRPESRPDRPFSSGRVGTRATAQSRAITTLPAEGRGGDVDPNRATAREGELDEIAKRVARGMLEARRGSAPRVRPDPVPVAGPDFSESGPIGTSSRPAFEAPVFDPAAPVIPVQATSTRRPSMAAEVGEDGPRAPAAEVPVVPAVARTAAAVDTDLEPDLGVLRRRPEPEPIVAEPSATLSSGAAYAPTDEPRRLLGRDAIAAMLFGLAVGIAVGMLAGVAATRGTVRETVLPLEQQLAEALSRPADVRNGHLRPPDELESELDETLSDLRQRYVLVWLGTALPLGFFLGRLKLG